MTPTRALGNCGGATTWGAVAGAAAGVTAVAVAAFVGAEAAGVSADKRAARVRKAAKAGRQAMRRDRFIISEFRFGCKFNLHV